MVSFPHQRSTPQLRQWLPLIVILLLLLLAGCKERPRLGPLPSDAVLLAFGDSLTYGTGAARGEDYPSRLSELVGRPVVNAGVPGEVSAEGLKRLPGLLARHRPTVVLLCHGGNDLLRRLDQGALAANLRAMVQLARESGAEVILVGVPSPGLFLKPASLYAEVAEEFRLPYLDETLGDILSDRSLKSDAVHPNARGYERMAAALEELIDDRRRD